MSNPTIPNTFPGSYQAYSQGAENSWEVHYDLRTPTNGLVAVRICGGMTQVNAELVEAALNAQHTNT